MDHYIKIGDRTISVSMGCEHPKLENNTCPTRSGQCEACEYGKANMTIEDFFRLYNAYTAKEKGKENK